MTLIPVGHCDINVEGSDQVEVTSCFQLGHHQDRSVACEEELFQKETLCEEQQPAPGSQSASPEMEGRMNACTVRFTGLRERH